MNVPYPEGLKVRLLWLFRSTVAAELLFSVASFIITDARLSLEDMPREMAAKHEITPDGLTRPKNQSMKVYTENKNKDKHSVRVKLTSLSALVKFFFLHLICFHC